MSTVTISEDDFNRLKGKAEAFDQIVAARKAYIDTVAAYNARLEFVRAERERGNWLNVDPEYRATTETAHVFVRIVRDLTDAALAFHPEKGEEDV